jgi:prolyl-tRNA synthetase
MNKPAAQQGHNKPKTAITPTREDDFPLWYQEVIKAADMAENSPVRGCMIIKPYGYAIWENMQKIFDGMIKELGVQNAYFPLLIPMEFMAREAQHVEGFAKECAVVTHHRLESDGKGGLRPAESAKLEEPYIIRPTSETIIGDAMSRWIQSYRDLPLKLNQWCNVMRWEMRTRMFLRTSEFLWQEGHNAFENKESAVEDTHKMLDAYADFAENSLAIPVIKGEKTADERFPGADMTLTIEAMMQDGKALQAGTSHYLGQNFARTMGIKFQGRTGAEEFAHTTSWGISTRLIGALIMSHADDDGMIMPPRIAPYHVYVIPIVKDEAGTSALLEYTRNLAKKLKDKGIRVYVDDSDERTPNKMWGAIKKGVPLRVEIGAREMEEDKLTYIRRDIGKDSKTTLTIDEFVNSVQGVLDDMHNTLFEKAKKFRDANIYDVSDLKAAEEFFKSGKTGFIRMDKKVIDDPAYEKLKGEYGLSSRCMPLAEPGKILIGKAY